MGREIIQETHLVGRESELRRRDNALRGAVAGRGGTVLVTGEAGMGKTRLVRHFMKSAEESGARILDGAVEAEKI